jgi:hypothetical protein
MSGCGGPSGDGSHEQKLDRLLKHPRVVKFFKRDTVLDRKHRIPFLAGYSVDGHTIYIDSTMPRSFPFKGREFKTDRFLIIHEELEKALIDALAWEYLGAHRIAIVAERRAVTAAGMPWEVYDAFMQEHVKRIRALPVRDVPLDLDLEPYKLEPALLAQIVATRGRRPAGRVDLKSNRPAPPNPPPNIPRNIPEPAKAPETGPSSSRPAKKKWFTIR